MSFIDTTTLPRELTKADMHRLRLGKRYWGCSIAQIPETAQYRKILTKYIDNLKENVESGNGILFYGKHGSGKTAAASILGKAVIAFGGTALFIEVQQLSDMKINKEMFDDETTLWQRMIEVDMLILDEIGGEHGKDWGLLERIIRHRMNTCKTTIGTTNKMKSLGEKYGEGLLSVIRTALLPIEIDEINWRKDERNTLAEKIIVANDN